MAYFDEHWAGRGPKFQCLLRLTKAREFPGGPVVRTLRFHCWGPGSIPGWGTKILQARGLKIIIIIRLTEAEYHLDIEALQCLFAFLCIYVPQI